MKAFPLATSTVTCQDIALPSSFQFLPFVSSSALSLASKQSIDTSIGLAYGPGEGRLSRGESEAWNSF
jgi:hypothetical protein